MFPVLMETSVERHLVLNRLLVGRYPVLRAQRGWREIGEGSAWDGAFPSALGAGPSSILMGHFPEEGKSLVRHLIPVGLFKLTASEAEVQQLNPGRGAGKEQCLLPRWSQSCSPPPFLVLGHHSRSQEQRSLTAASCSLGVCIY